MLFGFVWFGHSFPPETGGFDTYMPFRTALAVSLVMTLLDITPLHAWWVTPHNGATTPHWLFYLACHESQQDFFVSDACQVYRLFNSGYCVQVFTYKFK